MGKTKHIIEVKIEKLLAKYDNERLFVGVQQVYFDEITDEDIEAVNKDIIKRKRGNNNEKTK
tara:strand:- start:101 stop:286 length:186 start_codon:yes stop_codon:yes gene_type:complete